MKSQCEQCGKEKEVVELVNDRLEKICLCVECACKYYEPLTRAIEERTRREQNEKVHA